MDVSRLSPLYLTAASVQEPWDTSSADSNQPKLAAEHSLGSTISEGGLRNGYISGLGVDRSCTLETTAQMWLHHYRCSRTPGAGTC